MSRRELSEDAINGIQALDATIELIDERLPCSHGVVQDAKDQHDAVILLLLAATHALARGHRRGVVERFANGTLGTIFHSRPEASHLPKSTNVRHRRDPD